MYNSVFIAYVTWSFCLNVGVFYPSFREAFGKSHSITSWIQAVSYAIACGSGPFAAVFVKSWGCRRTVFVGTLLASAGLLVTSVATDITVVFVGYGILTGFGYSLIYMGAVVIVSERTTRYFMVAMVFTSSGTQLGGLVLPAMSTYFIESYGWRGAFMLLSGLTLHCAAVSLFFTPKKSDDTTSNKQEAPEDEITFRSASSVVLREPTFWVQCISEFSFQAGMNMFYSHIVAYSLSLGFTAYQSAFVLSASAIGGFIGTIVICLIGAYNKFQSEIMYFVFYFLFGVSILLCGVFNTFPWLVALSAISGFFGIGDGTISCDVAKRLKGSAYFSVTYGYMLVAVAIGSLCGPPLAGILLDTKLPYRHVFLAGGGIIIVGSSPFIFVSIRKFRLSRMNRTREPSVSVSIYSIQKNVQKTSSAFDVYLQQDSGFVNRFSATRIQVSLMDTSSSGTKEKPYETEETDKLSVLNEYRLARRQSSASSEDKFTVPRKYSFAGRRTSFANALVSDLMETSDNKTKVTVKVSVYQERCFAQRQSSVNNETSKSTVPRKYSFAGRRMSFAHAVVSDFM